MKIIEPRIYVPVSEITPHKLELIERYGRVCYKSEGLSSRDTSFVKRLINSGHESVIEHEKATVLMVTDRGVTHELVRHRVGSFSQESTRYCNYAKEKFGQEITVINPFFYENRPELFVAWQAQCESAEKAYFALLNDGQPQEARSILPNSLKTEIVVTFNFREWRHFFKLRCAPNAHPQMKQVAIPLLLKFQASLPSLFTDIPYDQNFPAKHYAEVVDSNEMFEPLPAG